MFHNLHLPAPTPIFTLNLSHQCFSIFISQHSRPPSHLHLSAPTPIFTLNLSHLCFSIFISQHSRPPSHLHLSTFLTSLNYSHSPPSSSLNLSHNPAPLNIFISHLSQPFVKALSTTPLLPQRRSGERTIIISHLSIFLSFSLSIVD